VTYFYIEIENWRHTQCGFPVRIAKAKCIKIYQIYYWSKHLKTKRYSWKLSQLNPLIAFLVLVRQNAQHHCSVIFSSGKTKRPASLLCHFSINKTHGALRNCDVIKINIIRRVLVEWKIRSNLYHMEKQSDFSW
jgi:hypothetical protein